MPLPSSHEPQQLQQPRLVPLPTGQPSTPLNFELPSQLQRAQSPPPPPYSEWTSQYNSEWERLKSFQYYPYQTEVNVLKMIKDGLYYIGDGVSAHVRCQFCSIIFDVRKISDLDQHRVKSPNCPQLQNPPRLTSNCSLATLPVGYDVPDLFATDVAANSTLATSYVRTNNQSTSLAQRIVAANAGRNISEILCFLFIINVFIFLLLASRQFF